jgi:hypothetical protein
MPLSSKIFLSFAFSNQSFMFTFLLSYTRYMLHPSHPQFDFHWIFVVIISTVHIVMCTCGEMTGSSSDDWILLTLWIQPLLITLSHNTVVILHILQTILTLIFSVLTCIHNSLLLLRALLC